MGAKSALGTTIAGSSTGTIGLVKNLDYTGIRRKVVTYPYLTMPGGYVTKRPGTVECGSLDLECWQEFGSGDPAKHRTALESLSTVAATDETWTITFPGGGTMAATGHVLSCIPFDTVENDQGIGFKLTIKLNSAPVMA